MILLECKCGETRDVSESVDLEWLVCKVCGRRNNWRDITSRFCDTCQEKVEGDICPKCGSCDLLPF